MMGDIDLVASDLTSKPLKLQEMKDMDVITKVSHIDVYFLLAPPHT